MHPMNQLLLCNPTLRWQIGLSGNPVDRGKIAGGSMGAQRDFVAGSISTRPNLEGSRLPWPRRKG